MVDQKIRFIAEWVDKGLKRGAKDAAKATKEMEEAGKRWKKQLAGISAAAGIAALAIRKFYTFAQEGAQLEFTALKFDRLAESIGSTGEALDKELYEATEGMLSQSKRMGLATEIVGLGLTKNTDQTVRLARVVSQLGADMNQVTLTLANRTTMRFDQIGIAVVGFDEKLKDLEAQGYSTEDAFTEAFLQQGEEQLEKIGSIAETNAAAFMQFEATIEDATSVLKTLAAIELGPVLDKWVRIIKLLLGGEISFARANIEFFKAAVLGLDWGLENLEASVEAANREIEQMTKHDLGRSLPSQTTVINNLADAFGASDEAARKMGRGMYEAEEATDDLAEATADLAENALDLNGNLAGTIENYLEQIDLLKNGMLPIQKNVEQAVFDYKSGLIGADEFQRKLNQSMVETMTIAGDFDKMSFNQIATEISEKLNIPLELARIYAEDVLEALGLIDGTNVSATITVKTATGQRVQVNEATMLPVIPSGPIAQQAGGDFIVPSWYTNDSFPVRATAGERVQVDSKSRTASDEVMRLIRDRRNNRELAREIANALIEVM